VAHETNETETFPINDRPWHEDAPTARKPRTKKAMKTQWSGWVQTYPVAGKPDIKGCSVTVGADTISELIQDIFRHGTYYLSLGYKVSVEKLRETCAACTGDGTIRAWRKGHGWTDKQCPECKGHAVISTLNDFDLRASMNVKIVQD
jgi:hypothetical protein